MIGSVSRQMKPQWLFDSGRFGSILPEVVILVSNSKREGSGENHFLPDFGRKSAERFAAEL